MVQSSASFTAIVGRATLVLAPGKATPLPVLDPTSLPLASWRTQVAATLIPASDDPPEDGAVTVTFG